MQASAAPAYQGNPNLVDPEEAFVAALSSCHMLTFLAIACKKRFVLDEYVDDATGVMEILRISTADCMDAWNHTRTMAVSSTNSNSLTLSATAVLLGAPITVRVTQYSGICLAIGIPERWQR